MRSLTEFWVAGGYTEVTRVRLAGLGGRFLGDAEGCAEPLRLVYGRGAEEALELAAELRGALVSDTLGCDGGSERVLHHEHSCFVKANGFEVLER